MATTTRPPKAARATPAQLKRYYELKLAAEVGPYTIKRLRDMGDGSFVVLDVRPADAYREAHVPGAMSIPFDQLPSRTSELPKGRDIICYCWEIACILSTKAAFVLASKGYQARELIGGIDAWKKAGFAVEKS